VRLSEQSTNNTVRLDGAASALVFHILRRCRNLATSVPKAYSTTVRLTIFGDRLEQQAFCGSASCKTVSLVAERFRPAQIPTSGSFLQWEAYWRLLIGIRSAGVVRQNRGRLHTVKLCPLQTINNDISMAARLLRVIRIGGV
jgi:hypothetical protein